MDKTSKSTSLPECSHTSLKRKKDSPTYQFKNERPQTLQLKNLQSIMSKQEVSPLQPIQKKENNTGLPTPLKTGIENLSGYAMDDIKVHYNSDKPAQLHAHAYAQGTNIHIARGQERHLPHEAWHVVQQKQGKVKPTIQMKGNVPINDDVSLEKEADEMGVKALQSNTTNIVNHPVQQIANRFYSAEANNIVLNKNTGSNIDVVQKAVSNSATYAPSPAATVLITALEAQIGAAETAASNFVQNIGLPAGYVHTPTQAAYMVHPSAALWGSCVEEQLNALAIALGWTTQHALTSSRPDYRQTLAGGIEVFVDLTTAGQAGPGGNHITAKLATAVAGGDDGTNWEAADITHAGLNPLQGGPAVVPHYNGNVTPLQMTRLQAYNAYCNDDGAAYDERKQRLSDRYRGAIHHATYTQVWNAADRQAFSGRARDAGF